jgi:hypothetical protein
MKIERLFVEDIDVGNRLRPIDEAAVVALAESMQRLGQLYPISVYRPDDSTLLLVTGLHTGSKPPSASDGTRSTRCLSPATRSIANFRRSPMHRSELTVLERDTQIGRWAELTAAKVGQVAPPSGGAQPAEKGVRKVARELNLERKDVERAVKVASISPEAKKAARVAGLDDNRTALLAVAKEATPEAQVAKVGAISSTKTATKAKDQVAAFKASNSNKWKEPS